MRKENTLTKKDLLSFIIVSFFLYFVATIPCENKIAALIIVTTAAIAMIVVCLLKIRKKELSEYVITKYFGLIGLLDSFVFAMLAVCHRGNSVKGMLLTFFIILGVVLVIIGLLELCLRRVTKEDYKNPRIYAGIAVVLLFSVLGRSLSRYLRGKGIEIEYDFILGALSAVFSLFYAAIIKCRKLSE